MTCSLRSDLVCWCRFPVLSRSPSDYRLPQLLPLDLVSVDQSNRQNISFFAVLPLDLVEVDQSNIRIISIQRPIVCFNGHRYTPRISNLSVHGSRICQRLSRTFQSARILNATFLTVYCSDFDDVFFGLSLYRMVRLLLVAGNHVIFSLLHP